MKKLIALLLTIVLLTFSLASCGNETDKDAVKVVDIPLTEEEYAFCVAPGNTELLETVNAFLKQSKENGVFDTSVNNYFGDGTPVGYEMGTVGDRSKQLVVATNTPFEPFEYTEGNKYYGIDIEFMAALAADMGKELVILEMSFDAIFSSVEAGYADIGAAGITYDESRTSVTFTDTYYKASQMLIVKADDTTFDNCKTAEDVFAILSAMGADKKVGAQNGTTGQLFMEGNEDFGYEGFALTVVGHVSGAQAVQDMINGNIDFVILDEGPAKSIVKAINE
ncbi:MAG: transporter substrate-binding domain-containing protein [Clostridia bacterium]|nr:transporter substrate-binding domain-containing protein [Clostridia bacterium]